MATSARDTPATDHDPSEPAPSTTETIKHCCARVSRPRTSVVDGSPDPRFTPTEPAPSTAETVKHLLLLAVVVAAAIAATVAAWSLTDPTDAPLRPIESIKL